MLECENSGSDGCSIKSVLYFIFAVGRCFSLFARDYVCSGMLFIINCSLPSEKQEFAQLLFSNSLLGGYHHSLLNQTAFGMCFMDKVPDLCSVFLYGLDFLVWI